MLAALRRVEAQLQTLENIMATIADIRAAVQAQTTELDSVRTLVVSLHEKLAEAVANVDPAALQEVVDLLADNAGVIADIKANAA